MNNSDFLPTKEGELLQWVINFLTALGKILERIGFPNAVYQQLEDLKNTFEAKYGIAVAPETRTKAAVQEKNSAREVLKKTLRQSIAEYLTRNHLLTDADRDNLGLPIHKTGRTPARIATTYPDFDIDSGTIRRLTIHFYDQGSKSKAKPDGQHGVEILWAISDTPILNVEDLIHSAFDTRSPFTLNFQGEERGKTVYFCLCWENTRGEKGPWSEIQSAIIP